MFTRLKSARKTATKSLKTVRICPILVDLEHMTKDELNYTVSFYKWYKKVNKSEYHSDTMYSFVICSQRYMSTMRYNYKFLYDEEFLQIQNTLDNVLKKAKESWSKKNQACPIKEDEENMLWFSGVLGASEYNI